MDPIDFRTVADKTEQVKINAVKDALVLQNGELEEKLSELKKHMPIHRYLACIQSLIYFTAHIRRITSENEKNALDVLFNELEIQNDKLPIWIDAKEGVNIFHALARSHGASECHLMTARWLFRNDLSSLLLQQDKEGFTPINAACKEGLHEMAIELVMMALSEFLHDTKSSVTKNFSLMMNSRTRLGFTPLLSASATSNGHHIFPWILKYQDIKDTSHFKNTPLHIATLNFSHENISFLLQNGADLFAKNKDQQTILNIFLKSPQHERKLDFFTYLIKTLSAEQLNTLINVSGLNWLTFFVALSKSSALKNADYFIPLGDVVYRNIGLLGINAVLAQYDFSNDTKAHNYRLTDFLLNLSFLFYTTTNQTQLQAYSMTFPADKHKICLWEINNLIEFVKPLFWSNNPKQCQQVAYWAKKHMENWKDYEAFMTQRDEKGQTIFEKWPSKDEKSVGAKLETYFKEKQNGLSPASSPVVKTGFFATGINNNNNNEQPSSAPQPK